MLVSECKDISESETIFNEIEKGEITISGISINLLSEQSKNIFNHSLLSNEHVVDLYTTAEQRNGYSQKFLCLATDSTPSQILNRYGVSLIKENQDIFVFLHPYLDTTSINSSVNNVVIMCPIYCKSLPLSDNENDKYYKKLEIHNYLLEVANILIKFQKEGDLKSIDKHGLKDYVSKTKSSNRMINVLLPKPDMVDINKVTIQISDETLGIISSDEIALNKIGNKQNIAYCGLESSEIQKPFSIKIDSIYMGDIFHDIQNATIINKSTVQNAFNKVKKEHDEETSKALLEVAEFIENSKEPSAGTLFNNFTEELNKSQPDKSRLKSFWSGIQNALPSIASISEAVAKIATLIN